MHYSKIAINSEHSAHYLKTLCRHFAVKVPATWDEKQGEVNFLMGSCLLTLNEACSQFELMCSTEEVVKLSTVKRILEQHISMLSRREEIEIIWSKDSVILQ